MIRIKIFCLAFCLGALGKNLFSQNDSVSFGVYFLNGGPDYRVNAGYTYTYHQLISTLPYGYDFGYGTSYDSRIAPHPKAKVNLAFDAAYKPKNHDFGFILSGSFYSLKDKVSGRVESNGLYYDDFNVRGTTMFGNARFPLENDTTHSASADVNYLAKNSINFSQVNLLMFRPISPTMHLFFGISFANIDNKRRDLETTTSFIYNYWYSSDKANFFHRQNDVSLDAVSAVYTEMVGITLGIDKNFAIFERLNLNLSAFGYLYRFSAKKENLWKDVDDIWAVTGPIGGPFEDYALVDYYHGDFPLNYNLNGYISAWEIKCKLNYSIGSFLISAGTLIKIINNVPMADNFTVSDNWTALESTSWHTNSKIIFAPSFYTGITLPITH